MKGRVIASAVRTSAVWISALLALALFPGCNTPSDDLTAADPAAATSSPPPDAPAEAAAPANKGPVGAPAGNEDIEMVVHGVDNDCHSNSGNQFDVPRGGNRWVCVDLQLTAKTRNISGYEVGDLTVVTADGFTYNSLASTLDSRAWAYDSIPAGQSVRKLWFYDVPANAPQVTEIRAGSFTWAIG